MATENFTSQGYGTKTADLRAAELGGEYRRGALKVDSELGYQDGNGPTLRKLQSCPPVLDLCFGAYGETSEGVKRLLDNLAESRVRGLGLRKGSLESAKELAQVTGHFRRRLSSAVMQVNVKYLLERILLVGEGQGQAGKRRLWARVEEERASLEREAQRLVKVTGRNLARRGEFPSI